MLFKVEERYKNLQNKLDTSEQKYEQLVKKSHSNLSSSENDFGPKNIAMAQVIICLHWFIHFDLN